MPVDRRTNIDTSADHSDWFGACKAVEARLLVC
jgi:hypothetical protein